MGASAGRAYVIAAIILALVAALIAADALRASPTQGESTGKWEKATDFTLTDIYGNTISLKKFKGKVVLLEFFSIHCPACDKEIPELKKLKSRFGAQLVIISISVSSSDTDEALRDYAEENGIDWFIARDTAGLADSYGIYYLPTIIIIDGDGYIRYRHEEFTPYESLKSEVESILGS